MDIKNLIFDASSFTLRNFSVLIFTVILLSVIRKIIDDSWNYYRSLLASDQAASAGVTEMSGYFFSSVSAAAVTHSHLQRVCPDYRAATPRELRLCPGDWKYGVFCTTVMADSTYQLSWLETR